MSSTPRSRKPTTERIRRAIQRSDESLLVLARRYKINPKTVAKWRHRKSVKELPRGPKVKRPTAMTADEEIIAISLRVRTQFSLDDCLYTLQPTIPRLTRSALHRCFQRHGVSRIEGRKTPHAPDELGHLFVDRASVPNLDGALYLFQATDHASKMVFAGLLERGDSQATSQFLGQVFEGLPYRVRTVTLDQDTFPVRWTHDERPYRRLEGMCAQYGVAFRIAPVTENWRNCRVQSIKASALAARRFHASHNKRCDVEAQLQQFLCGYNFARKLKCLNGRAPFDFVSELWARDSQLFCTDPTTHILARPENFGRAVLSQPIARNGR